MRHRAHHLLFPAVLGLVVAAPVAGLLITAWLTGWRFLTVETGSMRPLYPVGSLVAVEPIDSTNIEPGMVVVFRDPARPERSVAHRVVQQLPGPAWQTKGDANTDPDPWPITAQDVRGRVRWSVPGLGSIVPTVTGLRGAAVLVGAPLAALIASEAWVRVRCRRLHPLWTIDPTDQHL